MDRLIHIIKTLPQPGRRLENGLALRMTKADCFAVLSASRVAQPPGEQEMEILQKCILEIWNPSHIWRGRVTMRTRMVDGRLIEDHIWRLYWSSERLELVHEEAVQELLPFQE